MTTVAAPAAETVTYFHNDIAGTPQLATNASGALVWKENYLPYGQRQAQAPASAGNRLWYTGKPHEEDTGLTYMGARYYMPLVGRFTGMDPVDIVPGQPHSLNRYAYGNNNPYKYVDPDGRFPALLIPLIWSVAGAATSGAVNATAQQMATGHVQWGGVGGVLDAAGDGMLLGPVFGAAAARGSGAEVAANAAKGTAETTTVIGRVKDLKVLGPGEKSLLDRLPNRGNPQANWQQNAGVLREEMRLGKPIRDASPSDTSGQFLNAERNLLLDRGWTFDRATNFWMPPKQ